MAPLTGASVRIINLSPGVTSLTATWTEAGPGGPPEQLIFDGVPFGEASDYHTFADDVLNDSGWLQGTWRYYDQTLTEYQQEPNAFDADNTCVSEAIMSGTCTSIVAFEDPADPFDPTLLMTESPVQCEKWRNWRTVPLRSNDWVEGVECSY